MSIESDWLIARSRIAHAIDHLEELKHILHTKLAGIDRQIGVWAKQNPEKGNLEIETIDPPNAPQEATARPFDWIPDGLGIGEEFEPQFSDIDVIKLREARCLLGKDIEYLECILPELSEFPDSIAMLHVHQDLSEFEKLKHAVDNGAVPTLTAPTQETIALAQQLLEQIGLLRRVRAARAMRGFLHGGDADDLLLMLEALGIDPSQVMERRKGPPAFPEGNDLDFGLQEALNDLAQHEPVCGDLDGRSRKRKQLESIRELGNHPAAVETWITVAEDLELLKRLSEMAVRWNALARDLQLESLPGTTPKDGLAAAHGYALSLKIQDLVRIENEIHTAAARVFAYWPYGREVTNNAGRLSELETALQYHLTMNRLVTAGTTKARILKMLAGRTGNITKELGEFLCEGLGNPAVTNGEFETRWSELMAELSRIHSLRPHFLVVREICNKVEASGAPKYAAALKQPIRDFRDELLPDSWRKAWQLRRLITCLESIDGQEEGASQPEKGEGVRS